MALIRSFVCKQNRSIFQNNIMELDVYFHDLLYKKQTN